jgi:hypothetical protein
MQSVRAFESILEQDEALAKKRREFLSPTKVNGLALFGSLQHPADGHFDIVLAEYPQLPTWF